MKRFPTHTLALALVALVFVGCNGKEDEEDRSDEVTAFLNPPPNETVEDPEFKYEWEDLERDDQGRVNAYEKARWITERYEASLRLLRLDTPARVQAGEILDKVMRRAPDTSKARLLLAQLRFAEAAYWFQATDAWAYQIDWLLYFRTSPDDPRAEQGKRLNKEDLDTAIEKATPYVAEGNEKIRIAASQSLSHFLRYRARRPDDQQVADYLWKLYFYLQRFDEALQWLEYVLAGFESQEVPREDPLRKQYETTHKMLTDYLARLELSREEGVPAGASPLPWRDKNMRTEQRLLLSEGRKP
jgi:hypothetical protein